MALIYNCGNGFKKISFARKNMGMDAYLCCPGPSLKNIDPNILRGKGRKIFSINTTYPFIKPDIWLGMDKIECYDRNLLHEPFIKIFRAPLEKELFWDDKRISEYPETYFATIKEPEKGKTMFNYREHDVPFVWHKSTLMVALHMMIWMGAKDIYLAGCDLGGNTDYYDGARLNDEQRSYNRRLYKSQVKHLEELYKIGKKYNINLHSVTPNSPINDFMDYIPIEEAINKSEEKTKFKDNDTSIKHVLEIPRKTTVVCVYNASDKYNKDDYVYKLKESVNKHLPGMDFICLTNKEDLKGIKTKKLKYNWKGVFSKLELFEHFKKDRYLYIDLSAVVKDSLIPLTRFKKFTMIEDFVNSDVRSSAVMGWEGDFSFITEKFKKDPEKHMKEYAPLEERDEYKEEIKQKGGLILSGKRWISCVDQKFIEDTVGIENIDTWKKEYVSSYRISNKNWVEKSRIVVFHGGSKPHQVNWDPYRPELLTNNQFSGRADILCKLIKEKNYKNIVELGVGRGKTTQKLLDKCPNIHLTGIDEWKKRPQTNVEGSETYEDWDFNGLKKNAESIKNKYPNRLTLINKSTNEASMEFSTGSIDLIFIDADHTYEGVINDINNWLPKVKEGGIIAGHDINWNSVKRAVSESFDDYNIESDNVWWTEVDGLTKNESNNKKVESKLAVIIPTRGDRKDFLKLTQKMIKNQTIQPEKIYLIDHPPKNDYNDQIDRINMGVEMGERDKMERIIIFEDDDFYPDNYIETVLAEWGDEEIIGGYNYTIYHLNTRKHLNKTIDVCDETSPLHSTSFKTKTYKKFLESNVIEKNESGYTKNLDTFIWNWAKDSDIKRKQIKKKLVLSIKHNVGQSISLYHKDKTWETRGVSDVNLDYLRSWVKDNETFNYYTSFYGDDDTPENNMKGKILHITNWGIWGGVQSVVLSISKEYKEYNHIVFTVNKKNETEDCIRNYIKNDIRYFSYDGIIKEEDIKRINPDLIFLHSTMAKKVENDGEWLKNYKTIRVHHGWNLGELKHVDLNWFVSDFVFEKLNYPISKHFILPPVTYVKDYLGIKRPERKPVVGRIQSQTHIGGKPFPQTFYDLMEKLHTDLFIVGPDDPTIKNVIQHNKIEAGRMVEYLKEVDLFVIWQDKIETWCLVATEANLSGIPVVARRMNDGLTEQLNKSGGGILVNTEEEFINAVNKLLKDDKLRKEMANKGKDWLVENANTKLLRGHVYKLLNE